VNRFEAVVPPSIPRRGSHVWPLIGRAVLRLAGWRIEGAFPDEQKLVVAVAPHTSNWDFLHGAAGMFALDLRASFIGKHTLFVWPFSRFLRWMGGIPVDRSAANGIVGEAVRDFAVQPSRMLVIAPEGTRRKVERFRSGFLHIAKGAGVPVVLIALDYGSRCIRIGPVIQAVGDIDEDRRAIEAHFARIPGRNRP
jgi:1-acyl-sn-glycerol-3-phosphate acyltransferase